MEYDLIVIGSGSGGAATAAVAAHEGLKVLLLEKNERIGGACSFYYKDGFQVDIGTHTFGRGNSGPIGELTRRCGVGEPIEFIQTHDVFVCRSGEVTFRVPSQVRRLPYFFYDLLRQVDIPPRELYNLGRLIREVTTMSEAEILEWDGRSLEEYVRRFTSDEMLFSAISIIMGLFFILPPWKASAGESIWCLQKMMGLGRDAGYPKGGAVTVPRTFVEIARRHGARVLTGAPVRRILVEKGRAAGVVTQDGAEFRGQAVVSTTSLKDSVLELTGPEHFPKNYVERVRRIEGSQIAVQVKVALDAKLIKDTGLIIGMMREGGAPGGDGENLRDTFQVMMEGKIPPAVAVYAPIPTNYDPTLGPEGMQLITACTGAPTTDIPLLDPPEDWIDALLDTLEAMFPGFKDHIVWCDRVSVKACESWIGKTGGAAVTTGQTTGQTGLRRPPSRSPLQGLFFAGDCAGARGVGVELATQSGMDCAMEIVREFANGML